MKKRKQDRFRLLHIVAAAEKIERFCRRTETFELFAADELVLSGCIRELEVIGEASKHVSSELKEKHFTKAWEKATAQRNYLIHEYFRVETDVVWDTVQFHLPVFLEEVKTILSTLPDDDE